MIKNYCKAIVSISAIAALFGSAFFLNNTYAATHPFTMGGNLYDCTDPTADGYDVDQNLCYSWCFVQETKVTMADGSQKNIEDVRVGDWLKGSAGPNKVEFLVRKFNDGKVYSFNGGRYFVTDSHPFKTTEGWKSINPEATKLGHPGVEVEKLEVGDVLITENGNVELKTIDSKQDPQKVYTFGVDGTHDYYADGYLVHNKYPPNTPCPAGWFSIEDDIYSWSLSTANYGYNCYGRDLGAPVLLGSGGSPSAMIDTDIINMIYWDKNANGVFDSGTDRSLLIPTYAVSQSGDNGWLYYTTYYYTGFGWFNNGLNLSKAGTYSYGISLSSTPWVNLVNQGLTTNDPVTGSIYAGTGMRYYLSGVNVGLDFSCDGTGSEVLSFTEYSCPAGYLNYGMTCRTGSTVAGGPCVSNSDCSGGGTCVGGGYTPPISAFRYNDGATWNASHPYWNDQPHAPSMGDYCREGDEGGDSNPDPETPVPCWYYPGPNGNYCGDAIGGGGCGDFVPLAGTTTYGTCSTSSSNTITATEVIVAETVACTGTGGTGGGGTGSCSSNIGFNGQVYPIKIQADGKYIVGGTFTSYNGTPVGRIARLNLDGSLDTTFNNGGVGFASGDAGHDGTVNDIQIQPDGKIIVSGWFRTYNGVFADNIVRLNPDGSIDPTWVYVPGTTVGGAGDWGGSLTLQPDGKIIWSNTSNFTGAAGSGGSWLIRLNADGSYDNTFNNVAIKYLGSHFLQADGKIIVAGLFNTDASTSNPLRHIARLNTDGSLDTSFNNGGYGFNDWALYEGDVDPSGKILIGGKFTQYNGTNVGHIARLNSDGTLDTSFNNGGAGFTTATYNTYINNVYLQADGKVIAVGFFTAYNGASQKFIIRLNTDGTEDTSFNASGTGFAGNNIFGAAIQADGKIMVAGSFNSYNGVPVGNIARLNADGTLDTNFNTSCSSCVITTESPTVCDIDDPVMAGVCYIPGGFGTTVLVTDGKVGINSLSPSYPLDVDGTIRAAQILTLSDARLKSSIEKIDNALEKIRQINGYSFTWKDSGKPDLGVLAQEIEMVFSDAVKTDESGKKTVQYNALLAPVIEAIHELNTQIDALYNEKFDAQVKRIEAIENKVK